MPNLTFVSRVSYSVAFPIAGMPDPGMNNAISIHLIIIITLMYNLLDTKCSLYEGHKLINNNVEPKQITKIQNL